MLQIVCCNIKLQRVSPIFSRNPTQLYVVVREENRLSESSILQITVNTAWNCDVADFICLKNEKTYDCVKFLMSFFKLSFRLYKNFSSLRFLLLSVQPSLSVNETASVPCNSKLRLISHNKITLISVISWNKKREWNYVTYDCHCTFTVIASDVKIILIESYHSYFAI